MIEFKADCGHTVRAKDEDSGGVVRCSYCGRPATVPESRGGALDFLLNDFQASGSTVTPPRPRRKRTWFAKRANRPGGFNPFAVVVKLCYVALLIIVVIFVGRLWVLPLFKEGGVRDRVSRAVEGSLPKPRPQRGAPVEEARPSRHGLSARDRFPGLYVSSTPPGATVYCIELSRAPAKGRIHAVQGVHQLQATGSFSRINDGSYVVEVEFAWNDPAFTEFKDYLSFRRSIERGTDSERRRQMEQYFVADGAGDVLVDQSPDQIFLVRQYRDVEVRNQRSPGVRALFLPSIRREDRSLAIDVLLKDYLPKDVAYTFDETHVRNELRYYDVSASDEPFVVEALRRVGVLPYVTPDGQTRLFKIGMDDGMFAASLVHDLNP